MHGNPFKEVVGRILVAIEEHGVCDSPMRGDRVPRKGRAGFARVVAKGDDKIEVFARKLLPRLAPRIASINTAKLLQHADGVGIDEAFGTGTRAERLEAAPASFAHEVFGNNTPCGIARAKEENFEGTMGIHGGI